MATQNAPTINSTPSTTTAAMKALDEKAMAIYDALEGTALVSDWRDRMQRQCKRHDVPEDQVVLKLPDLLYQTGVIQELRQAIVDLQYQKQVEEMKLVRTCRKQTISHHTSRSSNSHSSHTSSWIEMLEEVDKVQKYWDLSIWEEVMNMVKDSHQVLCQYVPIQDDDESSKPTKPAGRFLYDGHDFLHTIQQIKANNITYTNKETTTTLPHTTNPMPLDWGTINVHIYTPDHDTEYQQLYKELHPQYPQYGLDEDFAQSKEQFIQYKATLGEKVIANGSNLVARQYAKTGCSINIRPHIWRQALSVHITKKEEDHYHNLETLSKQWQYITDQMYLLDVQHTTDSCDYFPFEDHLRSVMLCFSRDSSIYANATCTTSKPIQVSHEMRLEFESHRISTTADSIHHNGTHSMPLLLENEYQVVPPCGVLPFNGLVMFAAPICYLYDDPIQVYYTFRDMYCKYWCKLIHISSKSSTIVTLCRVFENLVIRHAPETFYHLLQVNINPISIAFPWIQSAFSGILEIDQVLVLWDRIIGYDSLEIVAIFAAGLFIFRSIELQQVTKMDDIKDLFGETIEIQVIPILQHFLFPIQ